MAVPTDAISSLRFMPFYFDYLFFRCFRCHYFLSSTPLLPLLFAFDAFSRHAFSPP